MFLTLSDLYLLTLSRLTREGVQLHHLSYDTHLNFNFKWCFETVTDCMTSTIYLNNKPNINKEFKGCLNPNLRFIFKLFFWSFQPHPTTTC